MKRTPEQERAAQAMREFRRECAQAIRRARRTIKRAKRGRTIRQAQASIGLALANARAFPNPDRASACSKRASDHLQLWQDYQADPDTPPHLLAKAAWNAELYTALHRTAPFR